jgi:SpoVK/Ycf46/Vps4 family AAA+-type ATPase
VRGDKRAVRNTAEAIIAEEHAKQHKVLAERLTKAIQANGHGSPAITPASDPIGRGRDFIAEIIPRRQLEDLILPEPCRRGVQELIEEQHRADLLRSHALEPRHRVLLVGAPGTGKTTLAEAIAEAIAVPYLRRSL